MMGIGEEPFRTWLIPLIFFIPISPFCYTKEPARSKRAAPYLRRSFWKAGSVAVLTGPTKRIRTLTTVYALER